MAQVSTVFGIARLLWLGHAHLHTFAGYDYHLQHDKLHLPRILAMKYL